MSKEYDLKLYVMGDTANSQAAIKNLNNILKKEIRDSYMLEVIDVLKQPNMAEQDKILATPMLIKISPGSAKRIIGDLSDEGKVRLVLGLNNGRKPLVNKD